MNGTVLQLNVKARAENERGLPKKQVEEAYVALTGVNGDYNRYRTETRGGDLAQAVLIVPLETIAQLNSEDWPVKPGDLGENITSQGIPYDNFAAGQRYKIGTAEIELTKQSKPCKNLHTLPYAGNEKGVEFVRALNNRRGWYAKVITEGVIRKGDTIEKIL